MSAWWAVVFLSLDEPRVDTYSGFGGDLYATRAEAEDVLSLTRATMSIHAPERRYELAHVVLVSPAGEPPPLSALSDPEARDE